MAAEIAASEAEVPASTASQGAMNPAVLFGWGLGSFTTAVLSNSVGLLHMRFMTDSLGVTALVAGSILGISKVYNAFIDPFVGALSDRTRSRWGRRRPYLFVGTLACAAAMVLMFNVPHFESQQALVIYMVVILLFYNTAYTVFRMPYLALPPEITTTFAQRSRLTTFTVYGNSIGNLFATTAAPFLLSYLGSNRAGHEQVALLLGALILMGGFGCVVGTGGIPTAPLQETARVDWRGRWRAMVENKPFMALIGFKIVMFLGFYTNAAAIPYFARHAIKMNDSWLASVFLARTLTAIISQPFWTFLARRYGRRNTLMAAALTEAFCMMCWFFVTKDNAMLAIIPVGFLQGLSSGGMLFSLYAALPDTMEYDRRRSGLQREGVFAGIFVMVEKFVAAISAALFGVMLGLLGYLESKDAGAIVQPDSAVQGIYVALSIVPALFALSACFFLRFYRLSEDDLKSARRS